MKKKIGGRTPGYLTNLALFPNADLVVAFLTNSDLTALPQSATYHIVDELLGLRKTKDWLKKAADDTEQYLARDVMRRNGTFPERIPNKPATHELSAYAGEYDHPGFGTTTIRLEGGKLHITLAAFKGVLAHYHYDSFTTALEMSTLRMGQLITFSTGTDGKVSEISFTIMGTSVTGKKR